MTSHYFVLIDKRDSEKFRMFRHAEFNKKIKHMLTENNSKFVWSFHKGQIKKNIWTKISDGDFVYFSVSENNFTVVGHVSKKITDKKIGHVMWPNNRDAEKITHFLLFNKLDSISVLYHDMTSYAKSKILAPISGIYEIKKEYYDRLQVQNKNTIRKPKKFILPKSINKTPGKDMYEVNRFLRDSTLVKKLKTHYDNKCQICGFTFKYDKDKFYSEVHHYNPLEEGGNDDMNNMIVVCPNHHSQFDYKIITIDIDRNTIINKQGIQVAKINFKPNHYLSEKNLLSQIRGN